MAFYASTEMVKPKTKTEQPPPFLRKELSLEDSPILEKAHNLCSNQTHTEAKHFLSLHSFNEKKEKRKKKLHTRMMETPSPAALWLWETFERLLLKIQPLLFISLLVYTLSGAEIRCMHI